MSMIRIGRQVGGLAPIILGAFLILCGDFAGPWENVPLTGPLRHDFAEIVGVVMILAGASMFIPRMAKGASLVLAALFALFAALWAPAIVHQPLVYDSWGNVAEESALAAGYVALFTSLISETSGNIERLAIGARLLFGVCSVSFGVAHFTSFAACSSFVPHWLPFGGAFWAAATGVAHLAVALALISGIWAPMAARLAAIMYLNFALICWGGFLFAQPTSHFAWGGEIVTLILAAAAWMVAECVAGLPLRKDEPGQYTKG